MEYKFKKQIFGWMDLLRFKKLVPNREKHLSEGSEKPLPTSYKVNEVAAILKKKQKILKLIPLSYLYRCYSAPDNMSL